jgi:XTP/dITP diphosphohydrolase
MSIEENQQALQAFDRLVKITAELRQKCPWDQQQNMHSLRPLTIEETFELAEAILKDDTSGIQEEVGDLLFHLLFYTRIATENQAFTLSDCINQACDKLIRRHPHIYQNEQAEVDMQEVKRNWQQNKLAEKGRESALEGIPSSLPSFHKAMCIQDRVLSMGFIWGKREDAWNKVLEELEELEEEVSNHSNENPRFIQMEDEFGDVLFTLMRYAQVIGIDPDKALEGANQKFTKRFQQIERLVEADGKQFRQLSQEELVAYWRKAKSQLT